MSYCWNCAYCARSFQKGFPQTAFFICLDCSKIGKIKEYRNGDVTFEKHKESEYKKEEIFKKARESTETATGVNL